MSGFDFGSFLPIIDMFRVGTLKEDILVLFLFLFFSSLYLSYQLFNGEKKQKKKKQKYDCDVKFASDMTIEMTIDFGVKLVMKTVNPINFAKVISFPCV